MAVRRSLLLAPALVLALSTGGVVSAAAAVPTPVVPPPPLQIDLSSDLAQGLIDRVLSQLPFPRFPTMPAAKEVANLTTIPPFIQRWQAAIARRDVGASVQAGQDYEAAWQAVKTYVNHRSLPLYTDIEVDTQFVIDDGLKQPQPDWPALSRLAEHLRQQVNRTIGFIAAQPRLSPLFDDLVPLRGVRAQLLISRDALTAGDVTKARTFFNNFKNGFTPNVQNLISVRSASALQEMKDALQAASVKFADSNATAAALTPLVARLLDRYGFGQNLLNAAARAADLHKTAVTDADRTLLTQLNDVTRGLKSSLPKFPSDPAGAAAGGATGPGSVFAKVQPALEAKARLVNTAATLRSALAAYATLVQSTPAPTLARVQAANKTALEAVALAQQTLVGQFWTDPALKTFLAGLPA
jgi:hypothetical protein